MVKLEWCLNLVYHASEVERPLLWCLYLIVLYSWSVLAFRVILAWFLPDGTMLNDCGFLCVVFVLGCKKHLE